MEKDPDILDLVRKLFRNWKLVAKWCCCGFAIGLFFALTSVKTYTVTSVLAPELSESSKLGSLSTITSMLGMGSAVKSSTDAMYPELYPDVISSTPFLVNLLDTPVSYEKGKETVNTNLFGYITRKSDIPVPDHFCVDSLTRAQDKAVRFLRHSISVSVDSKLNEFTLSVESRNQQAAVDVSRRIISDLQDYVGDYYTRKEKEDLDYYQRMYDQAKSEYNLAQSKYAAYVDANHGVTRQSVLVERDRLQNEVNMNYQLYATLAQSLQSAKAKLQESKPVIVTIQPPLYPYKGKPSRSKTVIIWTFLAGLLSVAYVLFFKDE
ncbi:MAG: hypothetical protein K5984_02790 [Bacteroidales bacterium]|nr:hypothetical protein [Bacteroidales bacterium]